jgi:uncharacterized protein (TIGR01777 family)
MAKILIAGGTGSIGTHLIDELISSGHEPVVLSRTVFENSKFKTFRWDPDKGYIDEKAFEGIDHIINLAGNGITDKRWTARRKAEIINSRLNSTKVLFTCLKKLNLRPLSFIGASAVGYYGTKNSEKIFTESDPPATDFLGDVCTRWEKSYEPIDALGIPISIVRIGIVFARSSGVYAKLVNPARFGFGTIFGSGKQYMPWIHIDDLVKIFSQLINGDIPKGIYNAVAPQHINNARFTHALASSVNRTIVLPKVPAFALKLALGEMSSMLLEGSRISDQKLIHAKFKFRHEIIESALSDLAGNSN